MVYNLVVQEMQTQNNPFMTKTDLQVFKINKELYKKNELRSWLWPFILATALYIAYHQFSLITQTRFIIAIAILLLLKTGNLFTQYRVTEIEIDRKSNQLSIVLKSLISGEKVKKYELAQVRSELVRNTGLMKLALSPDMLKLFLSPKDTFHISNRYGFSTETLAAINNAINFSK
jgi:hypothetical protein